MYKLKTSLPTIENHISHLGNSKKGYERIWDRPHNEQRIKEQDERQTETAKREAGSSENPKGQK